MQRNDELVHEIPVYQSKALNNQLYVIQYPLMPQKVSLEDWEVREIKVKPGQDRIQVTLDMNTKVRYDENKERSRATELEKDEDERNIPLEHQRVMATSGIPLSARSSRYVIGIVQGGKLHLSCIKSIVEMRDIVPRPDIREKDGKDVDADDSKMIPEADSEPTKISVKFNQLRENGPKPKYVRSYSFQRHQHQEYPWINLKHSQQDLLPKLSQNSFESETPFYCLSAKDYLELLFPKVVEVKPGISNSQAKSANVDKVPISEMKDLPIEEQLRNIMFSTQVIRYSDLVEVVHERLGGDIDDDTLLHSLQTVALVVQGCWVVKSDVLYPASFTSNAHGIGAIEMRRGRDVILSHLNQKRIVERPEMCSLTKLPNEEVTEILSGVAVVVPMTGWEFKYPFDSDFVATYPEVVQRHSLMLELKVSSTQRPPDFKLPPAITPSPQTSPRKSPGKTVSFSSDTDSGSDSGKKPTRKHKYSHKKK